MKTFGMAAAMAATFILSGCGSGGSSGAASSVQAVKGDVIVRIAKGARDFGGPLKIKPGTRVTWDNEDDVPHTVTSKSGLWDSGTLNAGEGAYSFVFTNPGTYNYGSTLDGQDGMTGTVIVTQ